MGIPYGLTNVNMDGLDLAAVDLDLGVKFGVTKLDGWEGAPKPSLEVVANVRRQGGTGGDSYSGSRHVTVGGWVQSRNPLAILPAKDALLSAFALDERRLTVFEVGVPRWVMARREDEPIITRKSLSYAEWSFQVISEDSRKFGDELSGTAFLPSSSGGLTIPFTIPFTIDATSNSGAVSLFNPGNDTGPVRLRIDGPCTGPVVTHVGSGLALVFSASLVLAAGEWIDVDMEAETVLANGQASRNTWITSRGWSGFEPGQNTWAFSAAAYDPAAMLTVFATPSWQ